MNDLGSRLERLGLSQYLEALVSEGFDTWATVLDITESDLSSLNVKLGHRRKLQRAIAEWRGQSSVRPLVIALNKSTSVDGHYRSDDSAPEGRVKQADTSAAASATSTKRKYRRHPKPDEHAPERPPSAYVIFSNQVRETLKGQDLSFTEIAKVVGEKWQVLPAEARETCERQANAAKEKYYAELAEYKKTSQYDAYQKYLEEFKAKHAAPTGGKRSKLETETSNSTASSTLDQNERAAAARRVSSVQLDPSTSNLPSEASPPALPARISSGPTLPSQSTSPAAHTLSGFNSPRTAPDPYSPLSMSPRSSGIHKEGFSEGYPSAVARDARAQSDASSHYAAPAYGHAQPQTSSSAPSGAGYGPHYQPSIELPSRRSMREMNRLPPLTHEDTTLSSDSGQTSHVSTQQPSILPIPETSKNMRVLPAPVPSIGATPSPLDRQPSSISPHQHSDYRNSAPLAALLRAGELARVAADEETEREGLF